MGVGGAVGYARADVSGGKADISNVNVKNSILNPLSMTLAGGMLGIVQGAQIRDSYCDTEININGGTTGGFVGVINDLAGAEFTNCAYTGKMSGNTAVNVGGFIGKSDLAAASIVEGKTFVNNMYVQNFVGAATAVGTAAAPISSGITPLSITPTEILGLAKGNTAPISTNAKVTPEAALCGYAFAGY
ncbi:MAG: hypothetical protein RR873_08455, partial [Christensenella sp.]